jgi:hypothetical protein
MRKRKGKVGQWTGETERKRGGKDGNAGKGRMGAPYGGGLAGEASRGEAHSRYITLFKALCLRCNDTQGVRKGSKQSEVSTVPFLTSFPIPFAGGTLLFFHSDGRCM